MSEAEEREKVIEQARRYLVATENAGKSLPEMLFGFYQHKMHKVLDELNKEIENNFPINSAMSNRLQEQFMDEKRGANWLLNQLKTKIKEG